jgi:hypothetical protein
LNVELVPVSSLRHIEGFSVLRVERLKAKIEKEGIWSKPIALDSDHDLVLDGQHRMEVALALGLTVVPALRFDYAEVEVWSLRPKYTFDWKTVVERVLAGNPYPYKTVKHGFPIPIPTCKYSLSELRV